MRDFTPITEIDLCAWLSQAAPQDAFEYHRGFLVLDTDPRISHLAKSDRLELLQVASRARWAAEKQLVHLVQRRLGESLFSYLAIARPRPAMPALSSLLLAEAPSPTSIRMMKETHPMSIRNRSAADAVASHSAKIEKILARIGSLRVAAGFCVNKDDCVRKHPTRNSPIPQDRRDKNIKRRGVGQQWTLDQ